MKEKFNKGQFATDPGAIDRKSFFSQTIAFLCVGEMLLPGL